MEQKETEYFKYKVYVKFKNKDYEFENIIRIEIIKNELVLFSEKETISINYSKVDYYVAQEMES